MRRKVVYVSAQQAKVTSKGKMGKDDGWFVSKMLGSRYKGFIQNLANGRCSTKYHSWSSMDSSKDIRVLL